MELALLFLPLASFVISGFFGKYIGDRLSEIITSLLVSISAILSLFIFYEVITKGYTNNIVIVFIQNFIKHIERKNCRC